MRSKSPKNHLKISFTPSNTANDHYTPLYRSKQSIISRNEPYDMSKAYLKYNLSQNTSKISQIQPKTQNPLISALQAKQKMKNGKQFQEILDAKGLIFQHDLDSIGRVKLPQSKEKASQINQLAQFQCLQAYYLKVPITGDTLKRQFALSQKQICNQLEFFGGLVPAFWNLIFGLGYWLRPKQVQKQATKEVKCSRSKFERYQTPQKRTLKSIIAKYQNKQSI